MKIFLIDGTSFCYRAFYAIRDLTDSKGRPTNAIYGVIMMLNKIINEEKPDYLAVVFDLKEPTFRHKLFEDYKVHRPPMPDDLSFQIPHIKDAIRAMGIKIYEKAGYEGEDIIATLCRKLPSKDAEILIATGDKDILQLVNERIKVYNTNKDGEILDAKKVVKKYGLGPDKVIDIMALIGDKSDNIPGVPGIGLKTAQCLIKDFGSLDELLARKDEVKSKKTRALLAEHEDNVRLSEELVTIESNVPLEVKLADLKIKNEDKHKLFEMSQEFDFRKLAKEYAPDAESQAKTYRLIENEKALAKIITSIEKKGVVSFDFETTGTDPHQALPIGIAFSFKDNEALYLPLLHNKKSKEPGMHVEAAFKKLKGMLENEQIMKIGQNIKYEYIILDRYGINLKGISFDTMVASYLLNPAKPNHNLDDIALEHLGYKKIALSELIGKGKKQISLREVALERVKDYACEDADVTLQLYKLLEAKLKEKELYKLFHDIELPLIEVLAYMEICGMSINDKKLKKMSKEMSKELSALEGKIYKCAGREFNINSPKQLREILFTELNLPVVKKTKTGASTDIEVLTKLSCQHELPGFILRYRELAKLKSTYVETLPGLVNPRTGRIHTSFNQTVTQTGRLSSSEPNLQNIPVKSEIGRQIREAFVPLNKDYLLLAADYSQIELRILAHLSRDKNLKQAFSEGLDIHTYTASLINDVAMDKVSSEMRQAAKTVNFSIIYGVSAYGLSRELNIEVAEAKEFIESYFARYPGVKKYIDSQIKDAEAKGYVSTIFGRRRYIPLINSSNQMQAGFARRVAINAPIQGTASDLIKIAMVDIYREFLRNDYKSRMNIQIHDELIFEVFKDELEEVKKLVKAKMEQAVKLSVPVRVDIKTGNNWAEC